MWVKASRFRTNNEPVMEAKPCCKFYLKHKALQQFRVLCWVLRSICESFTSLVQQILRQQLQDLEENYIQYNSKVVLSPLTVIMSSRTFNTFSLAWFFKLDIWLKVEKRVKWLKCPSVSQSSHHNQMIFYFSSHSDSKYEYGDACARKTTDRQVNRTGKAAADWS